ARSGWVGRGRWVSSTADGGATWSTAKLPVRPSHLWSAEVQCAGRAVWALLRDGVGSSQEAVVALRSFDRGAAWKPVLTEPYFPSLPPGVHVAGSIAGYAGPFAAVSASAFFTVECSPCERPVSIAWTADGGTRFHHRTLARGVQLGSPTAISFPDDRHGYVVVQGRYHPEILATTDGARTWAVAYPAVHSIPTPTPSSSATLSPVSEADALDAVAFAASH